MLNFSGMINKLIIISGLSGAGKTSALKGLEDNGFQAIDNLPISLFEQFISQVQSGIYPPDRPMAVGIDIRNIDFEALRVEKFASQLFLNFQALSVIYLECTDAQILRRYNETRRPHPLGASTLVDAINTEKNLLEPIKKLAHIQIDTTELQVRQLHHILNHYLDISLNNGLKILCLSFSYKKNIPTFADFVIDMRFLSNPFYVNTLQHLCGKDKSVQEFLKKDSRWELVSVHFLDFLKNAIDGYKEQGRSYLTFAFGCTGGQHRSVYTAEFFYTQFTKMGYDCHIEHRDLKV